MKRTFGIPQEKVLTVEEACILRVMVEAMSGKIQFLQFWAERTEGHPQTSISLSGDGEPLRIVEKIITKRLPLPDSPAAPPTEGAGNG